MNVAKCTGRSADVKQVRRVEGKRLVYYARQADSDFWDSHWEDINRRDFAWAEQGHLGEIEVPCLRHLPRQGRILEAGCGLGGQVLALRKRGWEAEGVEYAERTVEKVKRLYPDLPIRVGDVTNLDVPDGTYAGYISLGVVEHRQEGPEPFLREAYRILRPGGVALISVPYFHILRRIKARLGMFNADPGELAFYQYAFHPREFQDIVEQAGFEIIALYAYDPVKGIKDEIPLIKKMLGMRRLGHYLRVLFRRFTPVTRYLGHMFLVAAKRV